MPLALIGAEESVPMLARIGAPALGGRLPSVPLTTALPLPAKFRIRFLEPVRTDQPSRTPSEDERLVESLGQELRALIQENLLEMVAARRSVWLG